MTDQYTFRNPATLYSEIDTTAQYQEGAGLDVRLNNRADHGEESYRGTGRLTGRKALITGGDSGIGAAVAIAFAREGADVVISYLAEEQPDADRILGLVREAGRIGVGIPGDITDPAHCRALVEQAVAELGGLDIVVNNAAKQQHVESLVDLSDEQFDETMKTNVYATIITSSSNQAYTPSENLVDYATTKAAVNTLSKALAQQLAPKGIRVNIVAPGPIWTPLQTAGGQIIEELPELGQDTPIGRIGQPAELAPAYVFLASPESSYVVGETLTVNGGKPTP
jgi:NAD(P)-dependent dehydrogenase (short-subunit alcohol dehydrogenase family)